MNYPKCKNPIEDSVAVCEWCGASFVSISESQKLNSDLNTRLIELIKTKRQKEAISQYCQILGVSATEGRQYIANLKEDIARLDFFSKYPLVTQSTWLKEVERRERWKGFKWILLILNIFSIGVLTTEFSKDHLSIIIICIILALINIIWIRKK